MSQRTDPPRYGDVQTIGGMRVVCVPKYLITRVGYGLDSVGVLLPPDAADALIVAMRNAGLVLPDTETGTDPKR